MRVRIEADGQYARHVLVLGVAPGSETVAEKAMTAFKEEKVTIAGCAIRVLRGGSGPPLLYLHGAGGIPGAAPFMEMFAKRAELIVPEHPGFGASEDPPWLDNIHDLAYFYLSFMDILGLKQVHLVGMSLGGWIAAEMAVRDTSRLATLTLCGASGIHVKGAQKGDLFMWTPEELAHNSVYDQALAEKMIAAPVTPEQARIRVRNWRTVALLAWNPRLYDPHLYKWLGRIDVPTHIVWAEHDKLLPVDYASEFQRLIPGSTTAILPQCGHLMHVEKPAEFTRAVLGFIDGAKR